MYAPASLPEIGNESIWPPSVLVAAVQRPVLAAPGRLPAVAAASQLQLPAVVAASLSFVIRHWSFVISGEYHLPLPHCRGEQSFLRGFVAIEFTTDTTFVQNQDAIAHPNQFRHFARHEKNSFARIS